MNATYTDTQVRIRDEFRDDVFCFDRDGHSMLNIYTQVNQAYLSEDAIYYQGETTSKAELLYGARSVAEALLALDGKPGDAIIMAATNSPASVATVFGANAIGMKVYFINPLLNMGQILGEAQKFSAKFVFVSSVSYLEQAIQPNELKKQNMTIVDIEEPDSGYSREASLYMTFDVFIEKCKNVSSNRLRETLKQQDKNTEPLIYLQTSGSSSGKPKTLAFTNKAVFTTFATFMDMSDIKMHDPNVKRALCILPFRLAFGWISVFINLMAGNEIALIKGYNPALIKEYWDIHPSYVFGTPAIFNNFMGGTPTSYDLSFLRRFYCCGFSLPENDYQKYMKFLADHGAANAEISNGYGLGETLCLGTTFGGNHVEGSCGVFCNNLRILILDDNGEPTKIGQAGRLFIGADSLSQGYVGDEGATKESFVELGGKMYFKTGDLFKIDLSGNVYCLGREKRFYQPKGAPDKVNCETVANVILGFPSVNNCVVVHIPDDEGYDYGVAFVEEDDSGVDINKLQKYASKILLPYQMPAFYYVINKIPIANTGKPDYTALDKLAKEPLSLK